MGIDCRCEPCPLDIRRRGWRTSKEDPAFEGTHCLWHEQIRGTRGYIYPNGHGSVDVEITHVATLRQVAWESDERTPGAKTPKWLTHRRTKVVHLSELDYYAKLIGARRV